MMDTDYRLLIKVPLRVMALSASYALALALMERRFRLKPDHEWLEVAFGVGLTIVPVAMESHAIEQERKSGIHESSFDWKTYEGSIWRSFIAAGTPIILWQIGEAIVRKWELMKYLTGAMSRKDGVNGNTAIEMASGSGEPAKERLGSSDPSYSIPAGSTEES